MTDGEVAAAVRASSLAELVWRDPAGRPQVRGTLALVRGETPVLAFTYADEAVARAVARSPEVALALTEHRSTGAAFTPVLLRGRPRLVEDPTGEDFTDGLLEQELHRYPPSRLYADSPLLCRENWWYLPRLLVHLDVDAVEPVPARSPDRDHLLAVTVDDRLETRPVGVRGSSAGSLDLDPPGPPPGPGPAVVFGQDASFPDLEQWSQWRYVGSWDGRSFEVAEAPSRIGLSGPPGLLQRWRRQRDLERRCRQGIPRR